MNQNQDEFDFDDELEDEFLKLEENNGNIISSCNPANHSSIKAQTSYNGVERKPQSQGDLRDFEKADNQKNDELDSSMRESSASLSPSYSPKSPDSPELDLDMEFQELEKSCYFSKSSQNYGTPSVSVQSNAEMLEHKNESPLKSQSIASNFNANVSGEFNDSDDELFSQMNLSPQRFEIHNSTVPKEVISIHKENKESKENEYVDKQLMGPPKTPASRKRHSSACSNNAPQSPLLRTSNGDLESLEEFERFIGQNGDSVCHLKRRFPGPAGLLPNINETELKHLNHSPHPLSQRFSRIIAEDSVVHEKEVRALQGIIPRLEPRSVNEQLCLRKAPWRELLKQLKLDVNDRNCPIHFMNIKWIRTKAIKLNTFLKIPFLVAVLQEAPEIIVGRGKARLKNPSVKLIDSTGCIVAALDATIITSFGADLSPGTALALRNFGLIRFNKRQVILTITKKNLICVTSTITDNQNNTATPTEAVIITDENAPMISTVGDVKIMKFGEFDRDLVISEYKEITSAKAQSLDEMFGCDEVDSAGAEASVGLFTNISDLPNRSNDSRGSFEQTKISGNAVQMEVNSNSVDDMSAFDDDEDELFRAIDNIDFGSGIF